MKIAVCDDEKYFRDELKTAINTYSSTHRLDTAVDEFKSGEDFLKAEQNYDVVFLDYQMAELNGLETARLMREKNIQSTIFFVTNHSDVVYKSFEVGTFRFFKKPLNAQELYKALDDYFKEQERDCPIILKIDRENVCVQARDIVYLEADNKKCKINLSDGKILHSPQTMATVEKLLPKNIFFKPHKSFVVNFRHIRSYDNSTINFINGKVAHISRKYLGDFKEAYRIYAKGRAL
ncbi:MAG: LytTR family DNA-binding domain-containing protein [Oscillospiraceae bacterium]|nr:LytTR family DNA-binding domain-containing protein [Oscillospiraceae bacterium]MCL2280130.1 LytTR family DNA-binding domain-containing protein [Oscillospiraceae bacterium]